jgi:xylose isomerase
MRTYLILKERAARWAADKEIQEIVTSAAKATGQVPSVSEYSARNTETLLTHTFDRIALASRGLGYERLDQLTIEVLLGVR